MCVCVCVCLLPQHHSSISAHREIQHKERPETEEFPKHDSTTSGAGWWRFQYLRQRERWSDIGVYIRVCIFVEVFVFRMYHRSFHPARDKSCKRVPSHRESRTCSWISLSPVCPLEVQHHPLARTSSRPNQNRSRWSRTPGTCHPQRTHNLQDTQSRSC